MNRLTALTLIAVAAFATLGHQSQAQEQQQSAKPAYCGGPGAYRLTECGLTEKEAIAAEAAAAAAARAEAAARDPPLSREHIEFLLRSISREAKERCERPVSSMSMDDIEDCNKLGMRMLRGR